MSDAISLRKERLLLTFVRSYTVPSRVHTGRSSNGFRERAQQSKGSCARDKGSARALFVVARTRAAYSLKCTLRALPFGTGQSGSVRAQRMLGGSDVELREGCQHMCSAVRLWSVIHPPCPCLCREDVESGLLVSLVLAAPKSIEVAARGWLDLSWRCWGCWAGLCATLTTRCSFRHLLPSLLLSERCWSELSSERARTWPKSREPCFLTGTNRHSSCTSK